MIKNKGIHLQQFELIHHLKVYTEQKFEPGGTILRGSQVSRLTRLGYPHFQIILPHLF